LNADAWAADFDGFLRQGRIGAPAGEVAIALEAPAYAPNAPAIRGHLDVRHARLWSAGWRLRGDVAWHPLALRAADFAIPGPGRAGTVEFRVRAVADDEEEIVAWAFAELVWPAAEFRVTALPARILRHAPLRVAATVQWIEALYVACPDGTRVNHVVENAVARTIDLELPTHSVGPQRAEVTWRGADGAAGSQVLEYTVLARPVEIVLQPLVAGGFLYRTRFADALELHLPGNLEPLAMPREGVIEGGFVAPMHAVLRYRDEGDEWRQRSLRLDAGTPRWAPLRGFARL
jgi:hypothetical protein